MSADLSSSNERYKLLETLGEGGQGTVFKAFDLQLQRYVAVKRILRYKDGSADDALRREALTLANLKHPNIVSVHDVTSDDQGMLVVMELLEGEDLAQWLQGEKLSFDDVQQLGSQLLEALLAAHEVKVLHRDLKPENIRVSRLPGGRLQVKVIDFGLARASANNRRQTADQGHLKGSIHYMSPEQLEHRAMDGRSDLYSLACVMYKVLSGRTAFNGETVAEIIDAHVTHRVMPLLERNPELPEDLCTWVMWTMNRRAEDRPANAREALESFNAVFDNIKAGQHITRAIQSGVVQSSSTSTITSVQPLATQSAPISAAAAAEVPAESVQVQVRPSSGPAIAAPEQKKSSALPLIAAAIAVLGAGAYFLTSGGSAKPAAAPHSLPVAQITTPTVEPAPVTSTGEDKNKAPELPPVTPTVSATRPEPPIPMRIVARYISTDHLMRYGNLDAMKRRSVDLPAEPTLAISTWMDLVDAGGNRPLQVGQRMLKLSPRMELLSAPEAREKLPVVVFDEGQFMRAIYPLDTEDKIHFDAATSGGARGGHTFVLVARLRPPADSFMRIATLRLTGLPPDQRTGYQITLSKDRYLRFAPAVKGVEDEAAVTTEPVPENQLLIITCIASTTSKTSRVLVRCADGRELTSPEAPMKNGAPVIDEFVLGRKPGESTPNLDLFAEVAEIILYRSALETEMVQKLTGQLADHYFVKK